MIEPRFMPYFRVRRKLRHRPLSDERLHAAIENAVVELDPAEGAEIAIALPSRGIDRLDEVVRLLVARLQRAGAKPFLVPAMGSHGGGDDEGQVRTLARLGISESTTGAPVRQPGARREVGRHDSGRPLLIPEIVLRSQGLLLVNRVKLHTLFDGPVQSGLCKLLVFGIGGSVGAEAAHAHARELSGPRARLLSTLEGSVPKLLGALPPTQGLAIVEDETHALSTLVAVPGEDFLESDRRLLALSAAMHPRLPLAEGALLIVETMGKDISGTGFDPHVIGRSVGRRTQGGGFHQVYVRRLSPGTHGNGYGIGMVDRTVQDLVVELDPQATLLNAQASGEPTRAQLPEVHASDVEAVRAALDLAPPGPVMQIRDTNRLSEVLIGGLPIARLRDLGGEIVEELPPPFFDAAGTLIYQLQ